MKRIRSAFLVFLALLCLCEGITASAADDRLGTVVDGSLLTDQTSLETESVIGNTMARGTYLCYGSGGIALISSRTLSLCGSTACYQDVDKVKVKLYLQRLNGSTWNTIYISSTKVAYNTSYVSTSVEKTVTGGYYYRIKTTHIVIHDGTTETVTSNSDGLWVD